MYKNKENINYRLLIIDVDRYKQLMVILNVLGPGKWKMSEDETGF